jgi:hypothetical protein
MPFPDFKFFAEETNNIKNLILKNGSDGFQEFLKEQLVIRCFIPGGPAYGHYAACVNMVRRFIELGYSNTVEIFVSTDQKPLAKIYELIPELGNNLTNKIQDATIKIIDSDEEIELEEVNFGFCGACDYIDPAHDVGFLSKEYEGPSSLYNLKVRYFLMIQPYKWKVVAFARGGLAPGNLIFYQVGDKWGFLNLDTGCAYIIGESEEMEDNKKFYDFASFPPFRIQDLGFYFSIKNLCNKDWDTIISNYSDQEKLSNIHKLTTDASKYSIVPLYGFNYSASEKLATAFRKPVGERLAFVMASFQTARRTAENIERPTIIINFSPYDPKNDVANSFEEIIKLAQGEYTMAEKIFFKTRGEYSRSAVSRTKAFKPLGLETCFKKCTFENKDELEGGLRWLNDNPKGVLFIQADRVPPLVFNYILTIYRLPPIFEGNNTAIPAMMAGRPYLHVCDLSDLSAKINRYPQCAQGTADYSRVLRLTQDIQKTANQFQVDFAQWPQGLNDAPNTIVSKFIQKIFLNDEEIFGYFASIKAFFSKIDNDKLSISCSIFYNVFIGQNAK